MSDSKPSDETLKTALDLLCAMRSDVRREVFEDFIAGRSPHAPYLHVDAAEFMRIAERVNREIERRREADALIEAVEEWAGDHEGFPQNPSDARLMQALWRYEGDNLT